MKSVLACTTVIALVLLPVCSHAGPFVFSVKPGSNLQSSSIGWSHGHLTPYVGVDLLAIGADGTFTETEWEMRGGTEELYKEYE